MTRALRHRGPDDMRIDGDGAFAFGHTRLAIIELSERGAQPMWDRTRRHCLVYNGEVYNAPSLRRELRREGWQFRGRSDTEVVLQALVAWGLHALERFNGMFALALYDKAEERLLLARDRFGIKPMFYLRTQQGLLFASEIKSLLESPEVVRAIDSEALHEFMYYGNSLGERTLFSGVRRLTPGSWLEVDRVSGRAGAFWRLADVRPVRDDIEQARRTVASKLEGAVRRHLLSDVPVAALLSGGLDSSAVVALAAKNSPNQIRSFFVRFDTGSQHVEQARARDVAGRCGTEHEELELGSLHVPNLLERSIRSHDLPFGDAANLAILRTGDVLDGRTKILLQGDGGDEIFAGYRRYQLAMHRDAVSRTLGGLMRLGGRTGLWPEHRRQRLDRIAVALSEGDPAVRMARLLTEEKPNSEPTRVLNAGLRGIVSQHDPFIRYRELASQLVGFDEVQRMLYTDSGILLPDILLEKVDRASMTNSIEVRVPFLDADLCEYVMGLPASFKVRNIQRKWILRKALRGVLPYSVLWGRKRGFGVPYGRWLRGDLGAFARDHVRTLGKDDIVDRASVLQLLERHQSGADNHAFLLYKTLNLILWSRLYFPNGPTIA